MQKQTQAIEVIRSKEHAAIVNKMNAKILIGVDVGVTTGFAVFDKDKKGLVVVTSMMIHRAMEQVILYADNIGRDKMFVRFEDARLRTWFGGTGSEMWQGAGSIKRDSSIWEDYLRDKMINFETVKPAAKMSKWSADYFKSVTKWHGMTNEHGRDAAVLVWQ